LSTNGATIPSWGRPALKPETRDALLGAIRERHVRLLAPLAFVSPRIVAVIADGSAPADPTSTGLANSLPYSWAEQAERRNRSAWGAPFFIPVGIRPSAELAGMINANRENVNRCLRHWQRQGIIDIDKRWIIILQLEVLRTIAGHS
jgi:CRP-like cAMP-binding protein